MALNIASPSLSSFPIRDVSQKSFPLKTITCSVGKTRVRATKGVSSVCEPLPPDRPLWFPGSSPPPWLDGSLPGDFGFDPLGLGSDPESLRWFAQAELMHARWAMLAVAGILIPEWLQNLGFIENFNWYDAGVREYFADPTTLFVVQLALMGWVEGRRWADMINPGCVDIEPKLPHITKPKTDVGYPGGLWFDPLMWGMGSPEPVMVLRTKEIKNGRLAMLAFVGFWFQHIYTGQSPLENLQAHIADPGFYFALTLRIRAGLEINPPLMWSQINTGMQVVLGWTEEAMISGARDIGLSPAIVGTFPRKEAALVEVELIQRWRTSLMEKISFI